MKIMPETRACQGLEGGDLRSKYDPYLDRFLFFAKKSKGGFYVAKASKKVLAPERNISGASLQKHRKCSIEDFNIWQVIQAE